MKTKPKVKTGLPFITHHNESQVRDKAPGLEGPDERQGWVQSRNPTRLVLVCSGTASKRFLRSGGGSNSWLYNGESDAPAPTRDESRVRDAAAALKVKTNVKAGRWLRPAACPTPPRPWPSRVTFSVRKGLGGAGRAAAPGLK